MNTGGDPARTSLRDAVADVVAAARSLPRDVPVVFLAAAVLPLLSYTFGSRQFFYDQAGETLAADRLLPLYSYLYWFGAEFVAFFLLPCAIIIVVHRRPLRRFGLGIGDLKFGLRVSGLFIALMLPVLWIASDSASFQSVYPHAQLVKGEWNLFILYEAAFLLYFTGWEFIWRGYVLFGLERHLGGPVAVLVQMIPFVLLHFGKPFAESLGAVVAAIALGALALRTRSFWYCVLTHWVVMGAIDLFSTLRFRSGAHGIGIEAMRTLALFLFH